MFQLPFVLHNIFLIKAQRAYNILLTFPLAGGFYQNAKTFHLWNRLFPPQFSHWLYGYFTRCISSPPPLRDTSPKIRFFKNRIKGDCLKLRKQKPVYAMKYGLSSSWWNTEFASDFLPKKWSFPSSSKKGEEGNTGLPWYFMTHILKSSLFATYLMCFMPLVFTHGICLYSKHVREHQTWYCSALKAT